MALFTVAGSVYVGSDPELRFAPSGTAVCKFRAGTSRSKKMDDGSWETSHELWTTVVAFGPLAEHIAETLQKGNQAYVAGQIYENKWTNQEGEEKKNVEVLADAVQIIPKRGEGRPAQSRQGNAQPQQQQVREDPWGPQDSEPPF